MPVQRREGTPGRVLNVKPRVGRREEKCTFKKKKNRGSLEEEAVLPRRANVFIHPEKDEVIKRLLSQRGGPPHPTRRWAGPLS